MSQRILIADDDTDDLKTARRTVTEVVQKIGFAEAVLIEEYADSREFLHQLLHSDDIAMALSDTHMPEPDAIEILQALSSNHKHTPVLLMTGLNIDTMDMAERIGTGKGANVVATCAKPLSATEFERILRRHLQL